MAKLQELISAYQDGSLTRRAFIRRVILTTGGLATAQPHLTCLGISEAEAAQVDPNDPALDSKSIQFPGKARTVFAYLSKPKAGGAHWAIVCIHDNRGISSYMQDVVRRFAREGYVALAPDYLSRHGGTAGPLTRGPQHQRAGAE